MRNNRKTLVIAACIVLGTAAGFFVKTGARGCDDDTVTDPPRGETKPLFDVSMSSMTPSGF